MRQESSNLIFDEIQLISLCLLRMQKEADWKRVLKYVPKEFHMQLDNRYWDNAEAATSKVLKYLVRATRDPSCY